MEKKKRKLTPICVLHYVKLVYRSLLLILAAVMYFIGRRRSSDELFLGYEHDYWLLGVIWLVYVVEMACRFFPSRFESMGCQKQFRRNYRPTGETVPVLQNKWRTFTVALVWLLGNSVFGVLYYLDVIDAGILILLCLTYGVGDMICILFFCPFQTWFMKNRCCTVCRIYNWDFPMMFTPLVFIRHTHTWSLVLMSLCLLLRWEITVHRHPERFSEQTNACLSCKNCEEKLCHHKRQLIRFWKKNKSRLKFK